MRRSDPIALDAQFLACLILLSSTARANSRSVGFNILLRLQRLKCLDRLPSYLHGIPSFLIMSLEIPEKNDSGSRQATDSMPPTTGTTLEALRSPVSTTFASLQNRQSVSEAEFNDVALDDETVLSPVTLASRRTSTDSLLPRPEDDKNIRTDNSYDESPISVSMKHKKTVSTTTIRSSHDQSFFELQDTTKSNRGSVDGQQKLQD